MYLCLISLTTQSTQRRTGTSTGTNYVLSSAPVCHGSHENPGEQEKNLRLPEIKPNTLLSQVDDIDGGHCGVANVINKKGIALQTSQ